jgi:GTP-binding protein Era
VTEKTTSCFIAIVGKPNVGKSSLLNAIVGSKIAIVSDKPQTTRTRIMGVHTEGNLQLVFTDTPGQHRSHNKLDEYMHKSIREAMSGVDACVFVTEPEKEITDAEKSLLKRLKRDETPTVLVINKIDTLKDKAALLSVIDMWQKAHDFAEILPLSALTGEGIDALLEALKGYAFESPHFFPDDALTDQPERVIAAELIREKLLLSLQHEVPHGIAVVIESWHERETTAGDPIVDAEATIYCERESHKGIVIGKRGAMLQKIGTAARKDLEEMLGVRVNLQCWVKVREDWRNRAGQLQNFGYTREK